LIASGTLQNWFSISGGTMAMLSMNMEKKKRERRTQNKHEENLHQQKKIPQSIPQITNAIHPNGAFPCKD
jgi:hypothetical protein